MLVKDFHSQVPDTLEELIKLPGVGRKSAQRLAFHILGMSDEAVKGLTDTILDAKTRAQLINAATSRKNEAAHSFLGKIRDTIEQVMASENPSKEPPYEIMTDIQGRDIQDPEWDEYECSILRNLADDVKVSIRGDVVDMTVSKSFA